MAYTVWVNYVPGFLCVWLLGASEFREQQILARICRQTLLEVAARARLQHRRHHAGHGLEDWLVEHRMQMAHRRAHRTSAVQQWRALVARIRRVVLHFPGPRLSQWGYRRTRFIWLLWVLGIAVNAWSDSRSYFVSDRAHLVPAFFAGNLLYLYRTRLLRRSGHAEHCIGCGSDDQVPLVSVCANHARQCVAAAHLRLVGIRGLADSIASPVAGSSYGIYLWYMPAMWLLQLKGERLLPQQTSSLVLVAVLRRQSAGIALSNLQSDFGFWAKEANSIAAFLRSCQSRLCAQWPVRWTPSSRHRTAPPSSIAVA